MVTHLRLISVNRIVHVYMAKRTIGRVASKEAKNQDKHPKKPPFIAPQWRTHESLALRVEMMMNKHNEETARQAKNVPFEFVCVYFP